MEKSIITWKNYKFVDDNSLPPMKKEIDTYWKTVKDFRNYLYQQIKIPIEYIDIYVNNVEIKDDQPISILTKAQLVCVKTDPNKKFPENMLKLNIISLIENSDFFSSIPSEMIIEIDGTNHVDVLKQKIIELFQIKLNQNEYLAIFKRKGTENDVQLEELFDIKLICQYLLTNFQQLFVVKKQITNEVKPLIGKGSISVHIKDPQQNQERQITINQESTFQDLINMAANAFNLQPNDIRLIYQSKEVDKTWLPKTLFSQYIISDTSFAIIETGK